MRTPLSLSPSRDVYRYIHCLALAAGDPLRAVECAKTLYSGNTRVSDVLRSAVNAGSTIDPGFTALAQPRNLVGELIAAVRPATVLGKLVGQHPVPFNSRFAVIDSSAAFGWRTVS